MWIINVDTRGSSYGNSFQSRVYNKLSNEGIDYWARVLVLLLSEGIIIITIEFSLVGTLCCLVGLSS